MEDNSNNNNNNSRHISDYLLENELLQQSSANSRPPQLNSTICGCNCAKRGFVEGDVRQGGGGPSYSASDTYLEGQEGVESHMLAGIQVQAPVGSHLEPYIDFRHHGGFEGHHNEPNIGVIATGSGFEEGYLERIGSEDSMHMQVGSSGVRSMASRSFLSLRAESTDPTVLEIGAWTNPFINARSDYFFITAPLPLVAPVRCSCHAETDTEFNDDSSADLSYTSISDLSRDAMDDDSETRFVVAGGIEVWVNRVGH